MKYPRGFLVSGIHARIKRNPRKLDLAIIHSVVPATVAGVTTQNRVAAAPVLYARKVFRQGVAQTIVVNSGNANACTGKAGLYVVDREVEAVVAALGVKLAHVLVASTGIIGVLPDVAKLEVGIARVAKQLAPRKWPRVARAIMTTDLTLKQAWVGGSFRGQKYALGGVTKGSGMIHPNMGTMLAFLVTDLGMTQRLLQKALAEANRVSFNRISVDGDVSTNDMAVVMANGQSGIMLTSESEPLYQRFCKQLTQVCIDLAKEIARDGEGATKLIECLVTGARNEAEAEQVAKTVITSSLVKAAVHGEDPNWGRVIAAAGRSGVPLPPSRLRLWFGDKLIYRRGAPVRKPREHFRPALLKRDVLIYLDLGMGDARAVCWGCDLSARYVQINAAYS